MTRHLQLTLVDLVRGNGVRLFLRRLTQSIFTMDNANELLNLSEDEMVALWRRVMHLDPVRRECTVERDDGIDVDGLLRIHLRQWYAALLRTAQLAWLPIEDLRTQVTVTASADGVVTATLPARCVRPVEWQLAGWSHSVTEFAAPDSSVARRQLSPWTRSGTERPAAVLHDQRVLLYSLPAGVTPVLTLARCVAAPAAGHYALRHDALCTLPRWEI